MCCCDCPSSGSMTLGAQIVHIKECEGKLALLRTEDNVLLTHLSCSSFSSFLLFSVFFQIFIVFPPPQHFYYFPFSTTPHFCCFPSSSPTTTATFLLLSLLHHHHRHISIVQDLNEIPAHFIHEIKTKGYDVIGVNVFHRKLMRFHCKKG